MDFLNLFKGISGASMIISGGLMQAGAYDAAAQGTVDLGNYSAAVALQGGQISAAAYRSAETSVAQQTSYNIALTQFDLNRQLDSISRTIESNYSKNQAIQASSGVGLGSKSYLAVVNTMTQQNERTLLNLRNSAIMKQQELQYEGNLSQTQYENQAREAEYNSKVTAQQVQYQAEVQANNEENQANMAMSSAVSSAFSKLGSMFG